MVLHDLLFYVYSYIDFDIFVSHKEQFCNGTETIDGILKDGVYFQYRTSNNSVNRPWTTVDIYNGKVLYIYCDIHFNL